MKLTKKQIKENTCKVCKKTFIQYIKSGNHHPRKTIKIRPSNVKTCSRTCARIRSKEPLKYR